VCVCSAAPFPKNVVCQYCSERFHDQRSRNQHINIEHSTPARAAGVCVRVCVSVDECVCVGVCVCVSVFECVCV